jgi:hypothetical protein
MKKIKYILIFAIAISFLTANAQEKKIKFNKGTLKICSTKNFTIEGYDGNEVIIKSLHEKRNANLNYVVKGKNFARATSYGTSKNKNVTIVNGVSTLPRGKTDSVVARRIGFFNYDGNRKKGLKKLGKKNKNSELGIYFTIEQKDGELIFRDNTDGQLVMMSNERYEIKLPNSIKLNWETNGCKEKKENTRKYVFFNSKASSLSNFDGEVEISSFLNNMKLTDVTGPVSINSIGGNVTIEFDKKTPKKLYSIYSNNGFIDITLPGNSDVSLDATANDIFSDISFKVEEEKEDKDIQHMRLKLKSGKVKMKLNAGLGNIYLRKK